MIVIAIIGVLCAIAIPNIVKVRCIVSETLARRELKTLSDALGMYYNNNNSYPEDISALSSYLINPRILSATAFGPNSLGGYYYDYTYLGPQAYYYYATPMTGGLKRFYISNDGTVVEDGGWPSPSCPYLYVHDGSGFVKDNDIIPAATPSKLGERVDYYLLSKTLVPKDDRFYLKIVEEVPEVSYLDKIGLMMVDHPQDTQIAPDPQGNIWTIQNPIPPLSATDNSNKDAISRIKIRDDDFYETDKGGWVTVNFGRIPSKNGFRLILSTDVAPSCPSIHIQILNSDNKWRDVNVVHPHERWDIWAIDLGGLPFRKDKDIEIRLFSTDKHKVDYVALDISEQQPIVKTDLPIVKINSPLDPKMLKNIFNSDNRYVMMNKGDYIELEFPSYSQTNVKRDFILVSEGYYVPALKKTLIWKKNI